MSQDPGAGQHEPQPNPAQQTDPAQQAPSVSEEDMKWSGMVHLLGILSIVGFLGLIVVAVIFLVKKDQLGKFFERNAMESLFFQIGLAVVAAVIYVLMSFACIGWNLYPFYLALAIIFPIMAYNAASKGLPYSYPVTGSFVK